MTAGSQPGYPGEMLGLPQSGPGSLVSMGRRLVALLIDWLIAYGLALLALGVGVIPKTTLSTAILVVWLLLGVVAVRLFGFTPGQLALGLQVAAMNGRVPVGLGRLRCARAADRAGRPGVVRRFGRAWTAGQSDGDRGGAALILAGSSVRNLTPESACRRADMHARG